MIRTQIQLTEEQARALKAQARAEERSMSELVRECVAEYLARRRTPDVKDLARRARELKGRFRSGLPDLAEAHDRYLDDAFDSRVSSSTRRHFSRSSTQASPGTPK